MPEWFQAIASSQLAFTGCTKLLLGYSLIEKIESSSSYAVHPVLQEWAWQRQHEDSQAENHLLAIIVVSGAQASMEHPNYVDDPRRLLPHTDRLITHDLDLTNATYVKIDFLIGGGPFLKSLCHIGEFLRHETELNRAEKVLMQAVSMATTVKTDPDVSLRLNICLDKLRSNQGQCSEAEMLYQKVIQSYKGIHGQDLYWKHSALNGLGTIYIQQNKLGEAETLFAEALNLLKDMQDYNLETVVLNIKGLFFSLREQNKLWKVETALTRFLQDLEKQRDPECPLLRDVAFELGWTYYKQGKINEAEVLFERALQGVEKVHGIFILNVFLKISYLSDLYFEQGKLVVAEKISERALEICKGGMGEGYVRWHGNAIVVYWRHGDICKRQDKSIGAREWYLKAVSEIESYNGPDELLFKQIKEHFTTLDKVEENG